MAKKIKTPVVVTMMEDYPHYYKNGTTYTEVHSPRQYRQVKLTQNTTSIVNGSNVHVVDDAKANDTKTDKAVFQAAYNNALQRINIV